MRTLRQSRGQAAEDVAVSYLQDAGWRVVARNARVGPRDEIDIVALDPGPPVELVCVEVRSAVSSAFGAPEERIERRKVGNLYRAMLGLRLSAAMPRRVDLVLVDGRGPSLSIRHIRRLEPG